MKKIVVCFMLLILSGTAKADIIVAGVPNAFQTVEPTASVTAHTRYALQLIFENLVKVNLLQELEPSLAKKWRVDYKKNEIQFELNDNHFFSNGDKVTAEDVVFSFRKICSKESQARAELKGLIGCLDEKPFGATAISKTQLLLKSDIHPSILLLQKLNVIIA